MKRIDYRAIPEIAVQINVDRPSTQIYGNLKNLTGAVLFNVIVCCLLRKAFCLSKNTTDLVPKQLLLTSDQESFFFLLKLQPFLTALEG